jgi:hypothetical protein
MRIIEIILKLAFLALSVYLIVTQDVMSHWFMALLVTALILGVVLIFNKKQSYRYPVNWPKLDRVFMLRRVEGFLLVIASVSMLVFIHLN